MLYEESFTENADFDSTDSHLSFSKGYNETLRQIIKTQTVHFLTKLQMHYMMQLHIYSDTLHICAIKMITKQEITESAIKQSANSWNPEQMWPLNTFAVHL